MGRDAQAEPTMPIVLMDEEAHLSLTNSWAVLSGLTPEDQSGSKTGVEATVRPSPMLAPSPHALEGWRDGRIEG